MKNGLKRALSFMLALFMLVPLIGVMGIFAADGESEASGETQAPTYNPTIPEKTGGKSFTASSKLTVGNKLEVLPYTIEAEIQIPKAVTGRGGVIFGNYASSSDLCVSIEAYNSGQIRLYTIGANSKVTDVVFDKIDIRSDDYVRVSVAIDEAAGTATCYVNGDAQTQTKTFSYSTFTKVPTNNYMIGGDYRNGNERYFLGKIKAVSVYKDTRTASEIKAGTNLNDKDLLLAYDLEVGLKNLSSLEGYDLISTDARAWEADGGLSFSSANTYEMAKPFTSEVYTYEAMVWIPKSTASSIRVGAVCGNYSAGSDSVVFEFKEGATPRLYFGKSNGARYDFHFNNVDARRDGWTFVTIVVDPVNGEARCYIDGELKQTIVQTTINIPSTTYEGTYHLGNDTRGASGYPFQGGLKSLALYSDVRTADEIKADMQALNKDAGDVVAMYEFTKETGRSDISGNGYHVYYKGETRLEEEEKDDGTQGGGEGEVTTPTVEGMTFDYNTIALLQKDFPIDANTLTFEASILLPTTATGRGGVILGNYKDGDNHYFNFEIYNNGNPRISCTVPGDLNSRYDLVFTGVDVRSDTGSHIAITINKDTGEAICYLNGQYKQKLTKVGFEIPSEVNDLSMVLGNDLRTSDIQNFKGTIGTVAVYTDIRTVDEISADMLEIDPQSDNLEIYYNLKGLTAGEDITDLSGNGYTVKFGTRAQADLKNWFTDKEEVKDYLYSFAIVGDTQIIANRYGSDFSKIYDWILENRVSKKIGYVFGLGDITDANSSNEWKLAKENILDKLSGVIPYSVVRGNHDGVNNINSVFANETYMSQFDGFYDETSIVNSYRYFDIASTKYLLITLDYGASDAVLNWAGEIIASNPDRKVIITTHAYLYRDGTTLDQNDVCPPATTGGSNNGDHMWNKLVSQYENIFLVMSGHDPSARVVMTQTEGVHGNIVTQLLVDPQGLDANTVPTGMVTMLYVMADGSIEVETYSTIQEKYYGEKNQFTIEETEHSFKVTYAYEKGYLMPGTKITACIHCQKSSTEVAPALAVYKGTSVAEYGVSSVTVAYSIDYAQIELYEKAMGTKIELGVVACASERLSNKDNKPINANGEAAEVTGGKIAIGKIDKDYPNVSIIMKTDSWEKYADLEIIMCMYVIENGSVSYACSSTLTEAAVPITYNGVLSEQGGKKK